MSDLLVIGGNANIYQPDALDDFAAGYESGTVCRFQTKLIVPPDPGSGLPASESVFRRLYFTVVHRQGCAFFATPILDGEPLTALKAYFSRPAASRDERYPFMLPLFQANTRMPNLRTGLRGTGIGVLIEATDPGGTWHFETITAAYQAVSAFRGAKVGE